MVGRSILDRPTPGGARTKQVAFPSFHSACLSYFVGEDTGRSCFGLEELLEGLIVLKFLIAKKRVLDPDLSNRQEQYLLPSVPLFCPLALRSTRGVRVHQLCALCSMTFTPATTSRLVQPASDPTTPHCRQYQSNTHFTTPTTSGHTVSEPSLAFGDVWRES